VFLTAAFIHRPVRAGPILSVFPALIVHSELKSVHPGFPVAFKHELISCSNYHGNIMPETAFLGAQIAPKSLSAGASPQTPLGELTALPQLDSRGPTPKGKGGEGRTPKNCAPRKIP